MHANIITESVDSVYRDGMDMPYDIGSNTNGSLENSTKTTVTVVRDALLSQVLNTTQEIISAAVNSLSPLFSVTGSDSVLFNPIHPIVPV